MAMKSYILMKKDIPILSFTWGGDLLCFDGFQLHELDAGPVYLQADQLEIVWRRFSKWMHRRIRPWDKLRKPWADPWPSVFRCLGVNLSDQYWFRPKDSSLKWEAVSPFINNFNYGPYRPNACTNGNQTKHWELFNGKRILVKEATHQYCFANDEPDSEVIASKLLDALHVSHIIYWRGNRKGIPVSCCETFVTPNTELVPAWEIWCAVPPQENETNYTHFLRCIDALHIPFNESTLVNMLAFDYLIHNPDRHFGNFGFTRNVDTGQWIGIAPLYDHGNSLLYRISDEEFESPKWIHRLWEEKISKPFGREFCTLSADVQSLISENFSTLSEEKISQIFAESSLSGRKKEFLAKLVIQNFRQLV